MSTLHQDTREAAELRASEEQLKRRVSQLEGASCFIAPEENDMRHRVTAQVGERQQPPQTSDTTQDLRDRMAAAEKLVVEKEELANSLIAELDTMGNLYETLNGMDGSPWPPSCDHRVNTRRTCKGLGSRQGA